MSKNNDPMAKWEFNRIWGNDSETADLALLDLSTTRELPPGSLPEKVIDGIIHAISVIVEIRDPYTANHQRRVAALAEAISREMRLPERQINGIRVAGLLHDVGKIAIPAEILSKPGRINRHEFSIIKNHCQVGYRILQHIDFPWPVHQAIIQHHERLDGSGYPTGVTGEGIILEARVLGVADVIEAISSHRPYRPALGLKRALQEIEGSSGTQYDSAVVDACSRLLKRGETVFKRLMASAEVLDYSAAFARI